MGTQTFHSGAYLIGSVLRHQREKIIRSGRRLRLRDIADIAGYDSSSNISWIERGFARITSEHVSGIAKAYEIDLESFWVLWNVGRMIDEHTPASVLRHFLDRGDSGGGGFATADAITGDIPPSRGRANDHPVKPGDRQDVDWAIQAIKIALGYATDDQAKSSKLGVLIRNRVVITDAIKDARSLIFLCLNGLVQPALVNPEPA